MKKEDVAVDIYRREMAVCRYMPVQTGLIRKTVGRMTRSRQDTAGRMGDVR